MSDLVAFLRARLDEREKRIREVIDYLARLKNDDDDANGGWEFFGEFGQLVDPLIRPDEWLAEVEAERRILELLLQEGGERMFADVFRLLALPYTAHPDYHPDYRPESQP